MMILGYALKQMGVFSATDYKIPMKMVLYLTLPAAIITSFASYKATLSMLLCVIVGFALNWVLLGLAYFFSRKRPRSIRAVWLNCTPGYNVGIFCLPFIQSFLTPTSVVACCLFDAGSAIMCTGGTYALSCGILGDKGSMSLKEIGKKLLSSVPFLTYSIMLIWVMAGLPIPGVLVDFIHPIASANSFLAMFMIGMMFDLHIDKTHMRDICGMLAIRVVIAIAAAAACYFLLPLSLDVRQALALTSCAPISVVSTALSERAGGDPAVSAAVNSLSIPVGLVSIIVLLAVFGAL